MSDEELTRRCADRGGLDGAGGGLARLSPSRLWALVLGAEALLLVGYFGLTTATVTRPRYALYPFVWINAGLLAVSRTPVPDASTRHRALGGAVAAAYFLALVAIAGLVGFTEGSEAFGLRVSMASPGWGPILSYLGPVVHVTVIPYRVLGYLALTYLVYATVLETARSALSGVLGFASCISCSFSVLMSLVAGIAGGSSAVAAALYSLSIDISTAVFLLAVAVLYWRPELPGRRP